MAGRPEPVAVFPFTEIGEAHQVMREHRQSGGNLAALVRSPPRASPISPRSGAWRRLR
jgi:hypothetical protein